MGSKLRMVSNLFTLGIEMTSFNDSSAIEHLFFSGVIILCLCLVPMWRLITVFVLKEYLQTSHLNIFFTCQISGVGFILLFDNSSVLNFLSGVSCSKLMLQSHLLCC